MFTFKNYIEFTDVLSEALAPEKREVLLAIKEKHSKYQNFVQWLVSLHAGVMNDTIPLIRAKSILKQLDTNGIPLTFADRKQDPTEKPNFEPDGRLSKIYKPHLLGQNPNLNQYSRSGETWVRNA